MLNILRNNFYIILLLTACASTTHNMDRLPTSASFATEKDLQQIQNEQLLQQSLRYKIDHYHTKLKHAPPKSKAKRLPKEKDPQYLKLVNEFKSSIERTEIAKDELSLALSSGSTQGILRPRSLIFNANNPYQKIEYLNLDKELLEQIQNTEGKYTFIMDAIGHDKYALGISTELFDRDNLQRLSATLSCNSGFSIDRTTKLGKLSNTKTFKISDSGRAGAKFYLTFPVSSAENIECQLNIPKFKEYKNFKPISIQLTSNKNFLSSALNTEKEACLLPGKNKIIYNSNYQNLTCPQYIRSFNILVDPEDSLNIKVETLLGYKITQQELDKQDPYIELDFSKAPKYDAIYISALVFRHDFYGTLLLRILEHHAKNGTEIKIFNSKVIELEKDHIALKAFSDRYANVKYQAFKYPGRLFERGLNDKLNSLHRTNHIKAFITISNEHPELDNLIIGGRNIHDGFVFKSVADHYKYPDMVNYKGGDESFVHWMDLEVKINSSSLTRAVARQVLAVWNSDVNTAQFQPTEVQLPIQTMPSPLLALKVDENILRHIYSGPYQDDRVLEKLYVAMFDSARDKIRIVSPYLRLTPDLTSALQRAIDRNVKVSIYTRINLKGDTADLILTDVNKSAINKLKDKVSIYEWVEEGVILHSKLLVVDENISFVGGVNLNKRSFTHDFENGVIVYGHDINAEFNAIIDKYELGCRLVTEEQKTKWWTGVIINLLDDKF